MWLGCWCKIARQYAEALWSQGQVYVEETGCGSQASHSHHYKTGDEVSALEWLEECGLVSMRVSREKRLVEIEQWGDHIRHGIARMA
jgi:hypothetical protein